MATNNAVNISASGVVKYDGAGTFSGISLTQYSPLVGGASNAITSLGPLTNGQLVVGSTGVAPVAATLTAGAGVSITNGAGTITVATTGGGFTWTDVTGTSQSMAIDNGYVADNASLVTFSLPGTAAIGDTVIIVGKGAGGWTVALTGSQQIHVGSSASSTGSNGISSTNQWDSVTLTCVTANTIWTARAVQGNITVA